jgi:chromosome segregation ATPase
MEIYRIASEKTDIADLKDSLRSIKSDIRDLKKDSKDFDSKIKKIEKSIDDLNVGNRMFSQNKTIFTSLQRKIERMEEMSQEWKNYKKEMDDNIKKQVEKHTKARISDVTPQSF